MNFQFALDSIFPEDLMMIGRDLTPKVIDGSLNASTPSEYYRKNYCKLDPSSRLALGEVLDMMGAASARAQGLSQVITTMEKLRTSENHVVYIITEKHPDRDVEGADVCVGFLKVGRKRLFILDSTGGQNEVLPVSVLDFYVHESRQRHGYGRRLFDAMLQNEGVDPVHLAIDRPSDKLTSFLAKHYGLRQPCPQINNFVVYPGFFSDRDGDPLLGVRPAAANRPWSCGRGSSDWPEPVPASPSRRLSFPRPGRLCPGTLPASPLRGVSPVFRARRQQASLVPETSPVSVLRGVHVHSGPGGGPMPSVAGATRASVQESPSRDAPIHGLVSLVSGTPPSAPPQRPPSRCGPGRGPLPFVSGSPPASPSQTASAHCVPVNGPTPVVSGKPPGSPRPVGSPSRPVPGGRATPLVSQPPPASPEGGSRGRPVPPPAGVSPLRFCRRWSPLRRLSQQSGAPPPACPPVSSYPYPWVIPKDALFYPNKRRSPGKNSNEVTSMVGSNGAVNGSPAYSRHSHGGHLSASPSNSPCQSRREVRNLHDHHQLW